MSRDGDAPTPAAGRRIRVLLISVLLALSISAAIANDGGGDVAAASATCEADGTCHLHPSGDRGGHTDRDDDDDGDGDETEDLLRQISFAQRAGIHPITVVASIAPDVGQGVVYAGSDPLPPGATVGLYRALLVRTDVWHAWLDDGTVKREAWENFWRAYSVEFTGEEEEEEDVEEEDAGVVDVDDVREENEEEDRGAAAAAARRTWMAIPAGDVGGTIDGPTWWNHGRLPRTSLEGAIAAINARVLVDWRRLAAGGDDGGYLLFNAHIINEPSPSVAGDGDVVDEVENIGHLFGSDCRAFEGNNGEGVGAASEASDEEGEDNEEQIKWCGAAFSAKTSMTVHPGEQFFWCYGGTYGREYPVTKACLEK